MNRSTNGRVNKSKKNRMAKMHYMDTEYTFENSFTTLLNKKGREIIDKQLEDLKCQCCGKLIFRVTYMEGDEIHCETRGSWHDTGYDIDINSNIPKVVDKSKEEDKKKFKNIFLKRSLKG